jgi:hypothetical protein
MQLGVILFIGKLNSPVTLGDLVQGQVAVDSALRPRARSQSRDGAAVRGYASARCGQAEEVLDGSQHEASEYPGGLRQCPAVTRCILPTV